MTAMIVSLPLGVISITCDPLNTKESLEHSIFLSLVPFLMI